MEINTIRFIYIYNLMVFISYWPIDQVGRVFTNRVIPKTQKMVLDSFLLNTQHYKVYIKGKVEQSRERSSTLPYLSVVAIEKGAFEFLLTMITSFYLLYFIYIYIYIYKREK